MVSSEEMKLVADMNRIMNDGALARDNLACHNHKPGSIEEFLHVTGWVKRDLQLALCIEKPEYGRSQIACGNVTQAQLGVLKNAS